MTAPLTYRDLDGRPAFCLWDGERYWTGAELVLDLADALVWPVAPGSWEAAEAARLTALPGLMVRYLTTDQVTRTRSSRPSAGPRRARPRPRPAGPSATTSRS